MDSPALSRFLHGLGKVQHHLHTVVVGLNAVESGVATKPDDLDISWRPHDRVGSSREARQFTLRATLVFIAEEVDSYASATLRYLSLSGIDAGPIEHRADRIHALATLGEFEPPYLPEAALLVSHWRNRIVHRGSSGHLTAAERKNLISHAPQIYEAFKHLDINRALGDFERNQPSLKDVTALLAMIIRFARRTDMLIPQIDSPERIRFWLQVEGVLDQLVKIERQAANSGGSNPRRRGKQFLITNVPSLAAPYETYGIS